MEYIVKYQNDFVSSFLFSRNLPSMIEKGIEVKELLQSNVFSYSFDFDEWPSSHNNSDEISRPYNENMFMLRKHYKIVFPEEDYIPMDEIKSDEKLDSSKVYKIKYQLNLLPCLGQYMHKEKDPYTLVETIEIRNEDINLCELCAGSDEITMFESETLQDLIDFKWG
mgnify:CR=1 FL=1